MAYWSCYFTKKSNRGFPRPENYFKGSSRVKKVEKGRYLDNHKYYLTKMQTEFTGDCLLKNKNILSVTYNYSEYITAAESAIQRFWRLSWGRYIQAFVLAWIIPAWCFGMQHLWLGPHIQTGKLKIAAAWPLLSTAVSPQMLSRTVKGMVLSQLLSRSSLLMCKVDRFCWWEQSQKQCHCSYLSPPS